jgi:hypothetical protein
MKPFEGDAHGRGIGRPAERLDAFLSSLAARGRAVCAFKRMRFVK